MHSHVSSSLHFLDYWRVIKLHKFVIFTVLFLVVASASVYTFLAPKQYMATARIDVGSDRPDVSIYGRDNPTIDMVTFNTQTEVIQSKEVLYPVIDELKLRQLWAKKDAGGEELPRDKVYMMLRSRLALTPDRGTTLIRIQAWSQDREECARIANAVARGYEKYRLDEKYKESVRGLEKIQEEYQLKVEEVRVASEKVEQLRKELDITDMGGLNQINSLREEQEALKRKEIQLSDARLHRDKQKTRLESLSKLSTADLKDTLPALQTEADPGLPDLISKLMDSERRLAELKIATVGPNHPDFKQAKANYDTFRSQLDSKLNGIFQAEKIKLNEHEQTVKTLTEDFDRLRKREMDSHSSKYEPFFKATRQLELQQSLMKDVYDRLQKERIERGQPVTPIKITDPAEPPYTHSRPNIPLNLSLSVVVGLVLAIGIAFFIEYLDTSIHKVEDIENYLKMPVLGIVPRDVKPFNQVADSSAFAEFYRVLRANIDFSRKDTNANSITFCSAGAGEGKSTTLVNTAFIYAQNGNTVLIVDSDIRRPSLHRVFGMENTVGLAEIILQGVPVEQAIRATSVPNVYFISSGTYHSEALGILAMGRMRELIADLKQRFNIVFFDSPPVLGISDATILAREVDMAILVIQSHRFPRQFIMRAMLTLEKAGVRLLGGVLNQVKSQEDEYYHYNYEYYYGGTKSKPRSKKKTTPTSV
jgi:polysaccharide biosynthesis transport protein